MFLEWDGLFVGSFYDERGPNYRFLCHHACLFLSPRSAGPDPSASQTPHHHAAAHHPRCQGRSGHRTSLRAVDLLMTLVLRRGLLYEDARLFTVSGSSFQGINPVSSLWLKFKK